MYSEHELVEIENARTELAPLLAIVRGSSDLWHRTSVDSLRSILACGELQPNDGRFPTTYPQSNTCYGRYIGAVCLFDFDTEPLEECLLHAWKWRQFFHDCGPATVVIRIARSALDERRIELPTRMRGKNLPTVEREDGMPYVPMFIPRVEAWHKGPIPISAFKEYLVISRGAGVFRCERVHCFPSGLSRIHTLTDEWAADEERLRDERRARGEIDLAEVLRAVEKQADAT